VSVYVADGGKEVNIMYGTQKYIDMFIWAYAVCLLQVEYMVRYLANIELVREQIKIVSI